MDNNQEEQPNANHTAETEELNFDKPAFTFTPEAKHPWRQQGPYLVCKGCQVEHGVWIGMEKILVGFTEEGQPLLKDRA